MIQFIILKGHSGSYMERRQWEVVGRTGEKWSSTLVPPGKLLQSQAPQRAWSTAQAFLFIVLFHFGVKLPGGSNVQ